MHAKPQVLAVHVAAALLTLVVHFFAHPPQLLMSLVSSTQEPLQFESVPAQPEVHCPPASSPASAPDEEQFGVPASALHACPHAPQLFLSLVVSTHALPHWM